MSGRVVALEVNPQDPTQFYVAYASGGVWYTDNNGTSFESISDDWPTQNIGEIALDWNNVGEVEGFAKKQKLEVPVLLGNRGTAKDFRIQAFPTYYVLDGAKKVVRRNVGYSTSLGMRWNFAWVRAGGFGFQFLSFMFE